MAHSEQRDTKLCRVVSFCVYQRATKRVRVAVSMSTCSTSKGTADVHSSRIAYCQKRRQNRWPIAATMHTHLGIVIEQPSPCNLLFVTSTEGTVPLSRNVPAALSLHNVTHLNLV